MGRHKRKSGIKCRICSVCLGSFLPSLFTTPRCSSCTSSSQSTICEVCFHKHIFNIISNDINSLVMCPEHECNAKLPNEVIQHVLVKFGNQSLWEDYVLKFNWHGTSEQWLQYFSVKCPGCRVPIEKNGGCNHMTCSRCQSHFNWLRRKTASLIRVRIYEIITGVGLATVLYLLLFGVLILFFIKYLLYSREHSMSAMHNFM